MVSRIPIAHLLQAQDSRDAIQEKGWAPGEYMCNCTKCKRPFIGDKRAWKCAPCAYNDEGEIDGKEEDRPEESNGSDHHRMGEDSGEEGQDRTAQEDE